MSKKEHIELQISKRKVSTPRFHLGPPETCGVWKTTEMVQEASFFAKLTVCAYPKPSAIFEMDHGGKVASVSPEEANNHYQFTFFYTDMRVKRTSQYLTAYLSNTLGSLTTRKKLQVITGRTWKVLRNIYYTYLIVLRVTLLKFNV